MNGNQLMELADNYYKDAMTMGKWLKLSEEDQKIIALEAEIHDLCRCKPTKKESKKDDGKCKGKGKDGKDKKGGKDKWAWKKVPPQAWGKSDMKVHEQGLPLVSKP